MDKSRKMQELAVLEERMNRADFRSAEDVEQFFIDFTKIIWDHWMIGRIYDHYVDDTIIHGENGVEIRGIGPVVAHTSERLLSMSDFSINFIGIWAHKVNDQEYKFIQITYPEGSFTGPSIFGPPTGKKLGYDNIMNMCECLVKRIDGVWKIVEEWNLLGYAGFFSEGAEGAAEAATAVATAVATEGDARPAEPDGVEMAKNLA